MLTFNDILRVEGIDPADVRLVRHHDTRLSAGFSLYALWRAGDGRFERYQSIQSRNVFKVGGMLACFVVVPPPRNATLFVGMYEVRGISTAPQGARDPVSGVDISGARMYDLVPDSRNRLGDYVGKLTIEWGSGALAWVQHAARRTRDEEKRITEIRDVEDPPFPGITRFRCRTDELTNLFPSWREHLTNYKGVYLLVDEDSGDQYVGSAKGSDSLYGRLLEYASGGHGGNVELRARGPRTCRVSILAILDPATHDERIEEVESAWKEKLLTRRFGLNRN